MYKITFLLLLSVHCLLAGKAQGLSNLFSQKEAEIKYLIQQVAVLQVYIRDAEKGYQILNKGLTNIGNIKQADLSMHAGYFSSLMAVNPKITGSATVSGITDLNTEIIQAEQYHLNLINRSGQFVSAELAYIKTVFDKIVQQCNDNMNQLTLLLSSDNFQFSDNERLKRITDLQIDMQDKYQFVQSFGKQAEMLAVARLKDQHNGGTMQSLYDLKK